MPNDMVKHRPSGEIWVVCGYRFTPERENVYTAEEPRSVADMLTKAPTRFSAVDCPACGCQIALAIRAPRIDLSDITGDGRRNHFTTEWKSTDCFGRTLESPYTD